ncbi:hypothetical protein LEP1GSC096_3726 [Leptospira interrogans serovar Hebdomadis str. R499]|uniref:Uncharacterized protein n=1 Tax=Leptospira interrogans str. UI 12758 TaxID=1049938 RepID=A0A0E2D188_LEPIR|nr:hypothetical protein LEP1GSC096_3726 [Leptospira interrogans serovar Hebdomadis str. R499]EKR53603.1 hypothetical protein LEP1GSC105_2674 [Leptospira interrogans str. UI 12758]
MNPFTEKFLRQLDALRNHKEYSEIEPIVTDLLAMNSLEIIRSMTEDLSENFRKIENTYLSLEKNIRVIRFYWAGKEVFPHIPTTSWIDCYSGYELLADDSLRYKGHIAGKYRLKGKYTNENNRKEIRLYAFQEVLQNVLENEEEDEENVSELEIYEDLEILFILRTLEWTYDSIKAALENTTILKMQSTAFFVTPGQDEYSILVMDFKV